MSLEFQGATARSVEKPCKCTGGVGVANRATAEFLISDRQWELCGQRKRIDGNFAEFDS